MSTISTTKNYTTIILFAINQTGVLENICAILRTKMYNLETITASDSEKPNQKRITITVSDLDHTRINLLLSNLEALPEVISVAFTDIDLAVMREICLVKISKHIKITESIEIIEKYVGIVTFSNSEYFIAQISGTTAKIDKFLIEVNSLGTVLEFGRSGQVAMFK